MSLTLIENTNMSKMALTRIHSSYEESGGDISTLSEPVDGLEETFFVMSGKRKQTLNPKRVGDVWFPDSIDEGVREADQHADPEATHFDVFQVRGNDGRPTYCVARYYKL